MANATRSIDSLHRTLTTLAVPVLIDYETNTYYEVLDVDTDANKITVEPLPVVGVADSTTETIPSEDIVHLSSYDVVDQTALDNPTRVLEEYAGQQLANDIRVLGRKHDHNGVGVKTIADIEFALWAATSDSWPPTTSDHT